MKLGFIGCGNMALAIATGIIKSDLFPLNTIIATDIHKAARVQFENTTQISTTATLERVLQAEFIIIAIKPQQFEDFLQTNGSLIPSSSVVISIAAGKKINWLASFFQPNQPIVRIMPNLNATIGQSVSAVATNSFVTDSQFQIVTKLICSFGSMHHLDEQQFSTFTAIAGSSPAYFFQMIEAMSISAQQHGIEYESAKQIIIDTMIGSATFANTASASLPTLIQNVTSPNGTTEAALTVLNQAHFNQIIDEAQQACMKRDLELGSE